MIINEITLTDFRAFAGKQTLPLNPVDDQKPIILFGGLNGTGKTSTLMAIKLAFLGKDSLERNISKKEYEAFLVSCIHRNSASVIPKRQASVSLVFTLPSSESFDEYRITREWAIEPNQKVIESLSISQDGLILEELSSEQCQSFLNDIIPPGVANLLFFDGEKISELAEDTNGLALGDSIKKLIGVDLLDTLNTDLKSIQRRVLKRSGDKIISLKIEELENELKNTRRKIQKARLDINDKTVIHNEIKAEEFEQNQHLQSRGGAWADAREVFLQEEASLRAKIDSLESKLREIISTNLPLGLAPSFTKKVIDTLSNENAIQTQRKVNILLSQKMSKTKKGLLALHGPSEVEKIVDIIEKNLFIKLDDTKLVHDISESQISHFNSSLISAEDSIHKAQSISIELDKLNENLERLEHNINRAPDEEALAILKTKIESIALKKYEQSSKIIQAKSSLKSLLNDAISITFELRKLNNELNKSLDDNRVVDLCSRSSSVISKFAKSVTARKVVELETELKFSYSRLSRKKTLIPTPKIDPETFNIYLYDNGGSEINKQEMSAGEKQIFAIAMLEALGKVSGKELPVIIDTPLGRLDSHHREKILLEYFPKASHQVIILSTDTEINEDYQKQLSNHISHSIKLDYSEESKSTVVSNGYFWNDEQKKAALL